MSEFILSCCSTVDLPQGFLEKRNIPCIPYKYVIDGIEYRDDFGKTISFEDFYRRIDNGAMPTTSQVNCEEYIEFFEPILKSGKDILHICFSSGLTGSYNSARLAQLELSERYPNNKLLIVDSLAASAGYGLLVSEAWNKKQAGMDINELFKWLEDNKLKLHHFFFSMDLSHFKRGGRISPMAANLGKILNICPILKVDCSGKLVNFKKTMGKKKAMREVVELMKEYAENGTSYDGDCFISNSACLEDAETVADFINDAFPALRAKVSLSSIGTVIGAHTGPGTVALFFFGSKRVD